MPVLACLQQEATVCILLDWQPFFICLVHLAGRVAGRRTEIWVAAQDAVSALRSLPASQFATGWVLCCVGRAYFEKVDYAEAARHFEWARHVDPTRLEARSLPSRPVCNSKDSLLALLWNFP